ncbi:MAG: hypothetical protein A2X94_11965 [Bdellovibrionales bacterium GWB1_55_8]|nr:MAG: hypothetical protein A2X94_11965 [Bdellovibrionales bacterium GWB1_55_8]
MKTLTEFPAATLKNALKTRDELIASGKTPEELPQALGEALKVEGDRLSHLLNALECVGKKVSDLKRVVVLSLSEGEKAPSGAKQFGEHQYIAEYYPSLNPPKPARSDEHRGDRGGKGGKGRGGRGRDRDDKKRGAPRPPRPNQKPGGDQKA